jgi:branched-chain amino acid transport system substrate-binding protein
MTATKTVLLIGRRGALLGLADAPLAAPCIARAADPIKIGLLLAKTGQIADIDKVFGSQEEIGCKMG